MTDTRMSRERALKLLRGGIDGVREWNAWKETNPEGEVADGKERGLSFADLSTAELVGVDLSGEALVSCDLTGAKLREAQLFDADLKWARLEGSNLERANLVNAQLDGANLKNAGLWSATLCRASLREADLSSANLGQADLTSANLKHANLSGAFMEKARLVQASIVDASLVGTRLHNSDLRDARLMRANLRGAMIVGADLRFAWLPGAIFDNVCAQRADLRGTKIEGLSIEDMEFDSHTALSADQDLLSALWTRLLVNGQTYRRSDVESGEVALPLGSGGRVVEANGLILFFNTRITPLERWLVDGIIFDVLGRDTTCQVLEFWQGADSARMRLGLAPLRDLERLAEALCSRVWKDLSRKTELGLMQQGQLRDLLSHMSDQLDRIELRLPSEDAVQRQNEIGEAYVLDKYNRLFRNWDRTLLDMGKKALKGAAGKAATEVLDTALDQLKRGDR